MHRVAGQPQVHLDQAVGLVAVALVAQFDAVAVGFIAELGEDVPGRRHGSEHLLSGAAPVVVAAGDAMSHQQPVKASMPAVAGDAAGEALAVRAIGGRHAAAEIPALLEKVERADGLVAHGAGRRAEARIGGRRAGLHLDTLEEDRVDHARARVVPACRRLRHAVDRDGEIGLFHAQHVDALRGPPPPDTVTEDSREKSSDTLVGWILSRSSRVTRVPPVASTLSSPSPMMVIASRTVVPPFSLASWA